MHRVICFRHFFVGRNALEKKLIFLNKYFPGIFRRFPRDKLWRTLLSSHIDMETSFKEHWIEHFKSFPFIYRFILFRYSFTQKSFVEVSMVKSTVIRGGFTVFLPCSGQAFFTPFEMIFNLQLPHGWIQHEIYFPTMY